MVAERLLHAQLKQHNQHGNHEDTRDGSGDFPPEPIRVGDGRMLSWNLAAFFFNMMQSIIPRPDLIHED
jgi:hypothetical protein